MLFVCFELLLENFLDLEQGEDLSVVFTCLIATLGTWLVSVVAKDRDEAFCSVRTIITTQVLVITIVSDTLVT